MIKNNIESRLKRAKKYKVPKRVLERNTKAAFADLFYAENENYSLLYSILEDIEFAILNGECTDIDEVKDFIANNKNTYVYPKCEFDLDLED